MSVEWGLISSTQSCSEMPVFFPNLVGEPKIYHSLWMGLLCYCILFNSILFCYYYLNTWKHPAALYDSHICNFSCLPKGRRTDKVILVLGCVFIENTEDRVRRRLLKAVFKSLILSREYILGSEKFFCLGKVYFTMVFALSKEWKSASPNFS